jgi:ribosomal protein S18 acetylase RimI-like enzyme
MTSSVSPIRLGVYDRNVRAVRFYEKFGFTKRGGREFLFGGLYRFHLRLRSPE